MSRTLKLALIAGTLAAGPALAQPIAPVYSATAPDCTTADNMIIGGDGARYWFVDPGCDVYQIDLYERPTPQTFRTVNRKYVASEVFEYIDIASARHGFDGRYLYVSIDLYGRNHRTSDGSVIPVGMMERYGFRFSTDPDGRYGVLVVADQPEVKNEPNTTYGRIGTFAYADTNGDVGGASEGPTGLTVTKSDNPDEEDGMNGFDTPIVSDGRLSDETTVLWVRLSPTDNTVVEFALDYVALGFTQADMENLRYLDFEAIKGGPKDPQNYLWNDKYTKEEAGSPNKGRRGKNEFGTEGLGNIYEADTVRADLADFGGAHGPIDRLLFLRAISAGDASADINGDGAVDVHDLITAMERSQ